MQSRSSSQVERLGVLRGSLYENPDLVLWFFHLRIRCFSDCPWRVIRSTDWFGVACQRLRQLPHLNFSLSHLRKRKFRISIARTRRTKSVGKPPRPCRDNSNQRSHFCLDSGGSSTNLYIQISMSSIRIFNPSTQRACK